MIEAFVPYGVYEEIINILGQWKILDTKSLNEMVSYDISYPKLLKRVRKLESTGMIKSVFLGRKNKHIYLTERGLSLTTQDCSSELALETLTHDLIVSRVLRTLLDMNEFQVGRMFHQIGGNDLYPDAEVEGLRRGASYKLALEIELTQKSQSRVKEKFAKYGQGEFFDFVLFITNKESLYKAYRFYLEQMAKSIQNRVILMHDSELKITKSNPLRANCFYLGESVDFSSILGISGEK